MKVNRAQFCSTFGYTRHQFDVFISQGLPARKAGAGRGAGWVVDTAEAYRWLVEKAVREAGMAADAVADEQANIIDLNTERAKLAREQREGHRLKNAEARAELIPAPDVIEGWQAAIARARSLLLGLPAAVAEEIMLLAAEGPAAVRERLADLISSTLSELANTEVEDVEDAA